MKPKIKRPSFWRRRRRYKFSSYYRTAIAARKQIKNLILHTSSGAEQQRLRQHIKLVNAETISLAVQRDRQIRGLAS